MMANSIYLATDPNSRERAGLANASSILWVVVNSDGVEQSGVLS